ncbi:MAG: DUF2190 family protein [Ewingella sp.]|nr:DUF2190 family protein [Ewingella sp.]
MAKNFLQEGKTIAINNGTTKPIPSGDPVVIGAVIAVAIADIPAGTVGDGFTCGVFILPKVSTDIVPAGTAVFIKDGKIQLDSKDAVAAGIAWEDAGANATIVAVKING